MQELNEAVVRDRQAFGYLKHKIGYLKHKKHSVHIDLITKFLANIPPGGGAVLDLGCGPGPTTKLLAGKGFSVTAVDFSPESLRLNAESCAELSPPPTFVCADLRTWQPERDVAEGLMMSDFLQHIGDAKTQKAALSRYFSGLKPGGWFYLSFMNFNLKNRIKGDREGVWSGAIPYRRMNAYEVAAMLPEGVRPLAAQYANISHDTRLDAVLRRLPGAQWMARWALISGRKL